MIENVYIKKDFDLVNSSEMKKNINIALTKIAFLIEGEGKKKAPVKTGFLRNNISAKRATNYKSSVLSKAPYSSYVNYGTSKMKARPYLTNAVKDNMDKIETILKNEISDKIIKKI